MNKLCEKRNIDNGFSSTESDPHSLDETIIATLLKCVRFFRLAFVATSAVTVSVTEHSSSCVKKSISDFPLFMSVENCQGQDQNRSRSKTELFGHGKFTCVHNVY